MDLKKLSTKELASEMNRIATLLDDFDLHNHHLETAADAGWIELRDVLQGAASRLEMKV